MLSRHQAKMILSLQKKKTREDAGLFVLEGDKLVREYLMAGNRVSLLAAKSEWIAGESDEVLGMASEVVTVGYDELRKISSLKTPHNVLALAPTVKTVFLDAWLPGRHTLALEYVQDPGNLGTIIRIAAWFGIKNIICSPECVDIYNPKVLQATMGAFMHVNVHYTPLEPLLERARKNGIPVYGTVIGGESVYQKDLEMQGIILLGNESRGLTDKMLSLVTDFITIPGPEKPLAGIESLNVSMAAAIICSEFARRKTV